MFKALGVLTIVLSTLSWAADQCTGSKDCFDQPGCDQNTPGVNCTLLIDEGTYCVTIPEANGVRCELRSIETKKVVKQVSSPRCKDCQKDGPGSGDNPQGCDPSASSTWFISCDPFAL